MDLKYDIYSIHNSQGSGEKRQYVRLQLADPMPEERLLDKIQRRSSLTKSDVAAVLAEIRDLLVEEFSLGRRVHIPEVGYFSLSAGLVTPEDGPDKNVTGKEVRLTGINFRPEAGLMKNVQRNAHFIRARYSSQSNQYSEEKMRDKIKEYLRNERYITCRKMRITFGLTQYTAQKWLNHFCETGFLVKEGTRHTPIYFMTNDAD